MSLPVGSAVVRNKFDVEMAKNLEEANDACINAIIFSQNLEFSDVNIWQASFLLHKSPSASQRRRIDVPRHRVSSKIRWQGLLQTNASCNVPRHFQNKPCLKSNPPPSPRGAVKWNCCNTAPGSEASAWAELQFWGLRTVALKFETPGPVRLKAAFLLVKI